MGAHVELESWIASWSGVPRIAACSSGTAALHLALESLRLPLGSRVAVPQFTMVACARAVTLAGHTPVFADCRDDLCVDPAEVAELQPDAVLAVHVYGRRCDVESLAEFGVPIVEDLAEAHGLEPHPMSIPCWSFYRNKTVAGEEGGAVGLRSYDALEHVRSLRSQGFTPAHDFMHTPRGCNYRMADSLAELVLKSLQRFRETREWQRHQEIELDFQCPIEWRMPYRDAPWVYDFRVPSMSSEEQSAVVEALQAAGIAARRGFKPMTWQEEYRDDNCYPWKAAKASMEVVYVPFDADAELTFATVRRALEFNGAP